jgi:hypothetical protein
MKSFFITQNTNNGTWYVMCNQGEMFETFDNFVAGGESGLFLTQSGTLEDLVKELRSKNFDTSRFEFETASIACEALSKYISTITS